jgi:hypothetical protein
MAKNIDEILTYLVDNVVMIKARMIRNESFKDEGNEHNQRLKLEATQALAKREEALLTYLSDMYALPIKEVLKTAAMWREK